VIELVIGLCKISWEICPCGMIHICVHVIVCKSMCVCVCLCVNSVFVGVCVLECRCVHMHRLVCIGSFTWDNFPTFMDNPDFMFKQDLNEKWGSIFNNCMFYVHYIST
jgi:hypothetical protein